MIFDNFGMKLLGTNFVEVWSFAPLDWGLCDLGFARMT